MKTKRVLRFALALLLAAPLSGCLVAAAAGAGAAVYLTSRGASSIVQGTVDDVYGRAEDAFRQLGIGETGNSTERNGDERKLFGSRGEMTIVVEMSRESASSTKVEVTARRSAVEYDREFARDILTRIVGPAS